MLKNVNPFNITLLCQTETEYILSVLKYQITGDKFFILHTVHKLQLK